MIYKSIGYKPRDDWILCNCVMIGIARFRAVLTVQLQTVILYRQGL